MKLAHRDSGKSMTMMVDTGASGIHVTERGRKLLNEGGEQNAIPKRVVLDVGDGCCLHAEPLEKCNFNKYDLITGVDLLGKYGAVLNYARRTLTFQVGSQWRVTTLRSYC